MSEAETCWKVRVLRWRLSLWALSYARIEMTQPLAVNSGSTAAIWPLKIDVVALVALRGDLDLEVLAELQRVAVDLVALGVREPHHRHVGQREAVDDLDLERQVAPRGVELGAGDEDVDAGYVLL